MLLLDLLPELIAQIFEEIVLGGDLDIALMMRLVCKKFDEGIIQAIGRTRALEPVTLPIHQSNEVGLLSEYLVIRTLGDKFRKETYSKVVGETLDYILKIRPDDSARREEYLRVLCTATVQSHSRQLYRILNPNIPNNPVKVQPIIDHVLAAALLFGLVDLARHCIDQGARDSSTYFGFPSSITSGKGDLDMTLMILEQGFAEEYSKMSAVYSAASSGHTAIMQRIFDMNQCPEYTNANDDENNGWKAYASMLQFAARAGQLETTKYLVEKIASIATLEDASHIYLRGDNPMHLGRPVIALWYDFALWQAARKGQEEIVRWALDKGADHNITMFCHTFSYGSTFEEAAMNGYFRIANLLLARGAQISRESRPRRLRALRGAVGGGWIDVARIFLDKGFALQESGGYVGPRGVPKEDFLLFVAVSRGQVDMVKLLLERGAASSGISTVIGGEIYGYAVSHGYTSIIELLLEYKLPGTETA